METALDQLTRRQPRTILVVGASDTGKTTLLEQCLATWNLTESKAVVDCDVGQSHLGPPTTIGWAVVESPFSGWNQIAVRGMAFTGSVSPEHNHEIFLQATARIIHAAKAAAPRLLIDTTGWIEGDAAIALKRREVELIQPDLILAIQRDRELEPLLATLPPALVERLSAVPGCVRRSLAQRTAYRNTRFARYFANGATQRLALNRLTWIGVGPEWALREVTLSPDALIERVVGLRQAGGDDLALGLIRELDRERGTVSVFTPLREVSQVTAVAVGSVRWPEEGPLDDHPESSK